MGDMLSQAEIDALLNGTSLFDSSVDSSDSEEGLTSQEIDALGEIGNISMGSSATTLFTLLGQKVNITTPKVSITTWDELSKNYTLPFVAVKVEYTQGLMGSNLLVLKVDDVKIITNLMMGGDGRDLEGELTDLHLSAISEAMNQMIGSSATSMSSMFDKRIDISPPQAISMNFDNSNPYEEFKSAEKIVKIAFKITVGDLIDSEIMQLLPLTFAKSLVDNLLKVNMNDSYGETVTEKQSTSNPGKPLEQINMPPQQDAYHSQQQFNKQGDVHSNHEPVNNVSYQTPNNLHRNREPVNVHPANFQSFDEGMIALEKKNISLIMDVPLQVTVELGRTQKLIKDILEFSPGSIIELDKLAGEPVDILVNGKPIAKGEVVVIDESFGVRITDIIEPSKRL